MFYTVEIQRHAQNKLKSLSRTDRLRITDAIDELGQNPDSKTLDVKPLRGTGFHRLRVGQWRVVYERQDKVKIISIGKIGARGDVYK